MMYLLTEGVSDVAFLGRLLCITFGAKRIRVLEELPEVAQVWYNAKLWPPERMDGKTYIDRLSVPAPVVYRLGNHQTVMIRNAEGMERMSTLLITDMRTWTRQGEKPDAVGIVCDNDMSHPDERFLEMTQMLSDRRLAMPLPRPDTVGEVAPGPPRVGVFVLPQPGAHGTLEDLLLELGKVAYPSLSAAASQYVCGWSALTDGRGHDEDWKEIKQPSGVKKATLAAMGALLKPGKSMQVALESGRWLSSETLIAPGILPCVTFLQNLLGETPEGGSVP